ncbi:MAG: nucleotide exchange factor GrpE [Alphaproteobacteria bacterium]
MTTEPLQQPTAEAAPVVELPAGDTTAKERDEWKDKALRLAADMDNLRKRTQKDLEEARTFSLTHFARDMLTVADNMGRALEAINGKEAVDVKTLQEGVAMVAYQLEQTLKRHRVEKFNGVGEVANPERHQVMNTVPSNHPAGHVAQVLQAGYMLAGRLLRPALVTVSADKPAEPQGE